MTVSIAARVASALLPLIFSAAVPEFGVVDLIGHFVIIVLIVRIFGHTPVTEKLKPKDGAASAAALFVVFHFMPLAVEGSRFAAAHRLASWV